MYINTHAHVAILLGHLKMTFTEIKQSVLSCDTNSISEQHLRQLNNFAPDSKEVYRHSQLTVVYNGTLVRVWYYASMQHQMLTSYEGDPALLNKPDRFSLEVNPKPSCCLCFISLQMCGVECYKQRLSALIYRSFFKERADEIAEVMITI